MESFDNDMTRRLDGADAARDLTLIRDGEAGEVVECYALGWEDEWTEFRGDDLDNEDEAA